MLPLSDKEDCKMVRIRKQIILLLFSIFMVGSSIILGRIAWCDDDDLKIKIRELEKIKTQIEAMDQALDQNKNFQDQVSSQVSEMNTKIKNIEKELNQLNDLIHITSDEIECKENELIEIEAEIECKNKTLNSRLRTMYKTDVISYVEVLLGAEDFVDLITRVDMVQKILKQDQELIRSMEENKVLLTSKRHELEAQKKVYKEQSAIKVVMQTELEVELEALERYKSELENDEKALMAIETEFLSESNQLTQVIKNLDSSEAYIGGEMMWPVTDHYTIISQFGKRPHPISKKEIMHTGIDIACERNSNVVAAQSGIVIYANWYGSYGKVIILDHGGGYTTLYGYNDKLNVKVGDKVNRGDLISKSGTSGSTVKACLHFEVRVNGEYSDPLVYIKSK